MTYGPGARILSVIGLCMAVMAPPVSSQTEAVELRFRLKPEETLRYTIVVSSLAQTTIYDLGGATRTHLDRWSTTVLEEIRASAVRRGWGNVTRDNTTRNQNHRG